MNIFKINYPKLLGCIFVCFLAGVIGSLFTFSAIPGWYSGLNKPFFNPPNWVFAPVWNFLYLLMGISLYIIVGISKVKKEVLYVFFIQLILNTLWSIIFFGFKNIFLAYVEIIILWIFIILSILKFKKYSKIASFLLYPYFIWVTYASFLNLAIFILNR